ncbi:hydantoinase B/oxoprolinase family protein [Sphingomonas prati]|uniref:5-oxoprolinase (ATP-hydrolyzing) n=1 Tax=Sphingomonas prati TaxID=1843237 RepID=A0A7W9BQS2_9SPHN|nr:hydantoinase B/oxoprolinase family protein [Sphingomonas prati]MBB5727913.1 5-oxoprolinase (ATP-hydrolyzing) [Sphingomonas prati]GGE81829.1 5-oxoprolinase [Sphingomonas prati]
MWRFWVDRGGTFTDIVARAPDGSIRTAKLLSADPERYDDAAVAGIRRLTGIADGPLPPLELRMGTTVATNALLERKGARTLLAITAGFGDALRIGNQNRPDIFARDIRLPEPLYDDVVEICERVTAEGALLQAPDPDAVRAALGVAYEAGFRAIAVVLMHGHRHPAHEVIVADIARAVGFTQVSVSHVVGPLVKLIGRGDTTVADAYLSPGLAAYVDQVRAGLGAEARTLFMRSSGGLVDGALFHGRDAILSGPAGGIVGMAHTARAAGVDDVIGFDMGGTSTDVSHYAGRYERTNEAVVAGVRIRAPMMRIHTVAAGGGSICLVEQGRFRVGPESAGAVPGPACYRRGGPLTVTDCNLLLGRIRAEHFPSLFGPDGNQPLDRDAVVARFEERGLDMPASQAAEGFLAIAVANMANAIKTISTARGHDVTRYTLACFGGAGGQHACLVADALGMGRVMIHRHASLLSAYGMGMARQSAVRERTLGIALDADAGPAITAAVAALSDAARAELAEQGIVDAAVEGSAHLRQPGSESAIEVTLGDPAAMAADYAAAYRARFGYASDAVPVLDMLRIEAVEPGDGGDEPDWAAVGEDLEESATAWMDGAARSVAVRRRGALAAGTEVAGPALVVDATSTVVVDPGWSARVDALGNLMLARVDGVAGAVVGPELDPVRLEIFDGQFMAIAEEMGAALQHSASSVNIRERLDFSCALFDAHGNLIANAPHIPVHLGSMGDSIRTIIANRGGAADGRGILRGDVYALNAPYAGGTHLPDLTVIMPVFADGSDAPDFFVAARGHHADIGGSSPGSMPPGSTSVLEEGVLFDDVVVVDAERFREAEVRVLLAGGRWPARDPDRNIADLRAQIAACARGQAGLDALVERYGLVTVAAYMEHVQANADAAVKALIAELPEGAFAYELDGGAAVRVAVRIDRVGQTATVDFTGTSGQLPSNFNAPRSITRAAVMYVFRTLVGGTMPLNDGCLRSVEIVIPDGSMLSPRYPAAVVAGNVETSQVVTDALYGALGLLAASQGTMNNFTFGNAAHQYYETIAGGAGASAAADGASAVQTHMTNSRLTDPEVFEDRFPVLLERFAIRRGSGGAGAHRGGDGVVRHVRFREAMTAGILSNRRRVAPFGVAGGADGAVGINRVRRGDGSVEMLGSTALVEMAAGDVFLIETPGGGGFGTE